MPSNDACPQTAARTRSIKPTDTRDYVRVAVDLPVHPKILAMSNPTLAVGAVVTVLAHAKRDAGTGHVPVTVVRGIDDVLVKEMIAEGLWHDEHHTCGRCPIVRRGYLYVHDYVEHQGQPADAAAVHAAKVRAGGTGGQKRWAAQRAKQEAAQAQAVDEPAEDTPLRASAKRLCEYLAKYVTRTHSKQKRPWAEGHPPAGWVDAAEKLMRLDGYTVDEIRAVIKWCQTDPFWQTNIRSMTKFRLKFETLLGQSNNRARQQQNTIPGLTRRQQDAAIAGRTNDVDYAALAAAAMRGAPQEVQHGG